LKATNFDLFNQITLYALVKLFDEFPKPIQVNAKSIALEAVPKDEDESYDSAWDLMDFGVNTLSWLESEGFISIESKVYGGDFIGVRLTLKGLSLLGYSMPGLPPSEALIEQAKTALKEASKDSAKEILTKLFTGALMKAGDFL
jgi:hypothetical protein